MVGIQQILLLSFSLSFFYYRSNCAPVGVGAGAERAGEAG